MNSDKSLVPSQNLHVRFFLSILSNENQQMLRLFSIKKVIFEKFAHDAKCLIAYHYTNSQNSIITHGNVDSVAKILLILDPLLENSTTHITIIKNKRATLNDYVNKLLQETMSLTKQKVKATHLCKKMNAS